MKDINMKTKFLISALASVAAISMLGSFSNATALGQKSHEIKIAESVDNFQLTDHNRLAHELYYYKYSPAIVLMSYTNGSKFSQNSAVILEKIYQKYKDQGVLVYFVNSNLSQTRDSTAKEAKVRGYTVPILMDEMQFVGEQLGVTKDGEVFVIDPKNRFKIAYHGPASQVEPVLKNVLEERSSKTVYAKIAQGTTISFPERSRKEDFAKISYSKDIAPILQEKCVTCHLSGGIGPFAFDRYEVVKGFAPMIRESVRTERMPPYFADPHIGNFQNNQALTSNQAKTLIHWIEAGAPRGTGPDLLKDEARIAPEWPTQLGKPDVVVTLPAFDVPATGIVEYQNQKIPNPFNSDTWLRAISIKPGDRTVLHHVVSNHVPDPNLPKSTIPGGSVGSYTPGAEAQIIAENSGAPVPAGGKLNFQMHYTTSGKASTDRTQVGFYVLKSPPKYIKRSAVIGDFALSIPAGEARHKEVAYLEFPADAIVYTLYPHAHYRGMHVELTAKYPNGKEELLISLPKYDFNWQRDYDPVEPLKIPAGTKLIAKWVYDNSKYNPANPDPTINVRWGEQSHEEMMYFRINYRWADETVSNIRNDLQNQLMASRTIGALDDNADGFVQKDELRGPMSGMKNRFETIDIDKNGGLDKNELNNGGVRRTTVQAEQDTPDL